MTEYYTGNWLTDWLANTEEAVFAWLRAVPGGLARLPGQLARLPGRLIHLPSYLAPMALREVRAASHRRRMYLLRVLYVLALAGVIALRWNNLAVLRSDLAVRAFASDSGRKIFEEIVLFETLGLCILAALRLSGSVRSEIERGMLWALVGSPLSAGQIVWGKLAGGMVEVTVLAALALPVLMLMTIFGGLHWGMVVVAQVQVLLLAGIVGLVALQVNHSLSGGSGSIVNGMILAVMAPVAMALLLGNPLSLPVLVGILLLLGGKAVLSLNRVVRDFREDRPASRSVRYIYLPPPPPGAGPEITIPIEPSGAPLLVKKPSKWTWLGRRVTPSIMTEYAWLRFIGWMLALGATYAVARMGRIDEPLWHVFGNGSFQMTVVTIMLVVGLWILGMLAASSIASEKQARTWPILLTTPLGADDILRIKIRTILRYGWPAFGALGVHLAWSVATRGLNVFGALGVAIAGVSGAALVLAGGLYVSMRAAHPRQAKAWLIAAALAVWLALPWLAAQTLLPGKESVIADAPNPVAMSQAFAGHYASDLGREFPGGFGPLWLLTLFGAMLNLVLAGVLLWRTGRNLRRRAFD